MSADHRRHRDAGTGEFVSEEFAAEHPTTTTSESTDVPDPAPAQPDAEQLRVANNLAVMLSEQLGIPLEVTPRIEPEDADHAGPWQSVWIGMSIATAAEIQQQGRKLVAR